MVANMTEGAARSTVLQVTQVEPRHGFVGWRALVDGCAPKSSDDPAAALQPILPTHPKDARMQRKLKETLTGWSSQAVEYEHQFKVIDEAQKTFEVRGMMPEDIKREFLTGPRKVYGHFGKVGASSSTT